MGAVFLLKQSAINPNLYDDEAKIRVATQDSMKYFVYNVSNSKILVSGEYRNNSNKSFVS